jgi:hypothetical protein
MVSMLTRLQISRFLSVGTSKPLVYAAAVDNKETLHHCIAEAIQIIQNYPHPYEQMAWSMMRHDEACTKFH